MRQWMVLGLVLVLGSFGNGSAAYAAPISELEVAGFASNNSVSTAEVIAFSNFTLPVPVNVFNPPGFPTATLTGTSGPDDVDFYRISGSGQLILDVDNIPPSADPMLSLFNGNGDLVAFSDDAGVDPGSETIHDPLIFFTLPGPGVYFIAVTLFANFPCDEVLPCNAEDAFIAQNGPQPEEGGAIYQLHISLQNPIPMPPTLLLLVAVGGLAHLISRPWRRRH